MDKDYIPIVEDSLYFLYRRGKPDHIRALFERGEIFMNTIDYIRQCDENEDRSDPNDGIAKRIFLGDVKVKMCDVGSDIKKHGISMDGFNCTMLSDSTEKGNILCLSGIFSDHLLRNRDNLEFDTRTFGDSLILIINPKEFINRILAALDSSGYKNIQYKAVSYYPNNYSGPAGLFRKHIKFKDQNEFRIFAPNSTNKPISISIGPLSDIATMGTNELLKLTYTDGIEQVIRV